LEYFLKIIIVLFFCCNSIISQNSLQIIYQRFGKTKTFEFYENDKLKFKLNGELFSHKYKLIAMQDSVIMLENNQEIHLNQIKAVSFKNLPQNFHRYFFIAGTLFYALNIANSNFQGETTTIYERPVYITGAFFAAGILVYELNIKHIRITKNKIIRVVERAH